MKQFIYKYVIGLAFCLLVSNLSTVFTAPDQRSVAFDAYIPGSLLDKHIKRHGSLDSYSTHVSTAPNTNGTAQNTPNAASSAQNIKDSVKSKIIMLAMNMLSSEWIAYDCMLSLLSGTSRPPLLWLINNALTRWMPNYMISIAGFGQAPLSVATIAAIGAITLSYSLLYPQKRERIKQWVKNLFTPMSLATEATASCLSNTAYNKESPLHWTHYANTPWFSGSTISASIAALAIAYAAVTQGKQLLDSTAWSTMLKCVGVKIPTWWATLKHVLFGIPIPGSEEFEQYGLVRDALIAEKLI